MASHTVKQGEHLVRIARKYGFPKFELIWDHPNNAALKQLRKNPNILFPGDELFIPEKQLKTESRSTTQIHHFKLDGESLKLRLMIKDETDEPVASTSCKLNIQGDVSNEQTDGSGKLEKPIEAFAEEGMLDISGIQIPLKIGHLDPIEEQSGQKARLNNLGYNAGPVGEDDAEKLRSAVEEFQCDQNLRPLTGVCDARTQGKLKIVHGC